MQIITILLSDDPTGKTSVQVVPSDGIAPAEGMRACYQAAAMFQNLVIEDEVQRRLVERGDDEADLEHSPDVESTLKEEQC